MQMERLLLLWDDLDDVVGLARHGVVHIACAVADGGSRAIRRVTRLFPGAQLPRTTALEAASET